MESLLYLIKHGRGRHTVKCPLRLYFLIGRKFLGTIDMNFSGFLMIENVLKSLACGL